MKLYLEDCFNIFPKLESNSIDLVLCDMPYGTTACKWDAVIDLDKMWKELNRIVKDNAAIVLFSQMPFSALLVSSNYVDFKYEIIWDKIKGTGHLNAKKMPMKNHENIEVFYKKLPTYNPQKTAGHKKKTANNVNRQYKQSECYGRQSSITHYSSTERYPRSIQKFSTDTQKSKLHPTQKPVALLEYLIKTYSNEGDTVLDFCMGSGTTGVACKNFKRNFIGIEKEEKYFEIAKERIIQL